MLYQYTLYSKVQFNRQEIKRLLTVIIRHGIVNSSHKLYLLIFLKMMHGINAGHKLILTVLTTKLTRPLYPIQLRQHN